VDETHPPLFRVDFSGHWGALEKTQVLLEKTAASGQTGFSVVDTQTLPLKLVPSRHTGVSAEMQTLPLMLVLAGHVGELVETHLAPLRVDWSGQ
jgi:hypothetical protein